LREDFRALLRDLLVFFGDGVDRREEAQPVFRGCSADL
jgi:hypothetical protein